MDCSNITTGWFVLGVIAIYAWIGFLVYKWLLQCDGCFDSDDERALCSIFWPILAIGWFAGYYIVRLVSLPIVGATQKDIKDLEDKIETSRTPCTPVIKPKFKVGDLITGIAGNPDGYKHLYEGCKCRVITIDEKGKMELLLLEHKDKEAQRKFIGDTFVAPSRNFVLIKPARSRRR